METRNELLDGKQCVLIRPIHTAWVRARVLWEALVIDVVDI